jgi:hypothetical protein
MRRTLKYSSPGLVLAAIALIVALGGTSIAGNNAQSAAKPKVKPQVTQVTQPAGIPPQGTNAGILDVTVNCPAGTLVVGGGALDLRAPGSPLEAFAEATDGPSGNGWRFQFDNDLNDGITVPVSLTALCLKDTLKVKGLK